MQIFALATLALVAAQESTDPVPAGEDCAETGECTDFMLVCATGSMMGVMTCQECGMTGSRTYMDETTFSCPNDQDASASLAASAMAILAVATMMA